MSNNYIVAFSDSINIFDATRVERYELFNALRDKQETSPFFKSLANILRTKKVKSIYSIDSDGTIDDLMEYYNNDPTGFIIDVESDGEKIYSR